MAELLPASLIRPDWPAPAGVHACSSTRLGGVSLPPWDSLNLGDHVGDDAAAVHANRARLTRALGLSRPPCWLQQVHGSGVVVAEQQTDSPAVADAAISFAAGQPCVVMTADCLPILLCSLDGSVVAAVHAGWRGLVTGVVEQAVAGMQQPAARLMAWIGPAISAAAFEVGAEVRDAFIARHRDNEPAFVPGRSGHWWADLPGLAQLALQRIGVSRVYGGDLCTYADSRRFFSYRRDGNCGRMASLIWRD